MWELSVCVKYLDDQMCSLYQHTAWNYNIPQCNVLDLTVHFQYNIESFYGNVKS